MNTGQSIWYGATCLVLAGCDEPSSTRRPEIGPTVRAAVAPRTYPTSAPTTPSSPPRRDHFAVPAQFTALGTEPFWAAKVNGGRLLYITPEDQRGRDIAITATGAADFASIAGRIDGVDLRLRIMAGPCSDGMSDTVYPFTAELTLGDVVNRGCARRD
jgi:uncharacterized membrane protein